MSKIWYFYKSLSSNKSFNSISRALDILYRLSSLGLLTIFKASKLQASDDWKYVKAGMTWNVGPAGWGSSSTNNGVTTYTGDANSVSALKSLEGAFHWIGDIALITQSEYIRANSNSSCLANSALAANTDNCRMTNYLYKLGYWYWLLSPTSGNTYRVLEAINLGFVRSTYVNYADSSVYPTLFLKSTITLTGNGTNDENIYTIS